MIFDNPKMLMYQRMDDTFQGQPVSIDTAAKRITLTHPDWKVELELGYERPEDGKLILDGTIDGGKHHYELRKVDRDKFLLVSRGFHWVQERPFNR